MYQYCYDFAKPKHRNTAKYGYGQLYGKLEDVYKDLAGDLERSFDSREATAHKKKQKSDWTNER